ncbi:MAG: hypothetical protein FP814_00295 [Desulfobacterium sp.]|nr:hypothetical protein [Desulfobacterium sp.]MBU3949686.1 hypothetical protein [Pseudomonadota bacterium]MBU4009385.1 hypothetical protein [Pseudomonadota bacterium]MBU4035414.1 hypothetical protein [Pseudomonadota bacterium]
MITNEQGVNIDVKIDRDNLYIEESFTDLTAGYIRRLTPVTPDGLPDNSRKTIFIAQTQVMTQGGPLPIQGPIEADNFKQALEKFPAAVNEAVEMLIERSNEMRRQEASKIVLPGSEVSSIFTK